MRDHILPVIGGKALAEVQPKDINDVVQGMRSAGRAPRTVRNAYSDLSAMFRDAAVSGLIDVRDNPCILRSSHLGAVEDAKPGWRDGAVLSRMELRLLLTDPRIPSDRRVTYGLLGLAALRAGEMVALRWGDIRTGKPLNRIMVTKSHHNDRTKTRAERRMPIHPALQSILEAWAVEWPKEFGRPFTDDDLVVPVTVSRSKGPRSEVGEMRGLNYLYKRWVGDLRKFDLRHRRIHDLRRTFISLARGDGAIWDILKWGTHAPPSGVGNLYTTFEWKALCVEVLKLNYTLLPVNSEEDENDICDQGSGRALFNTKESPEVTA